MGVTTVPVSDLTSQINPLVVFDYLSLSLWLVGFGRERLPGMLDWRILVESLPDRRFSGGGVINFVF